MYMGISIAFILDSRVCIVGLTFLNGLGLKDLPS